MPSRNRGVALVMVLMVVALVAIVATEMGSRLQLQIQRVVNIKDNNQAYWYAMGAEQFALKSLLELQQKADGVVHRNQPWAAEDIQFPLPQGMIEARLEDAQSCFNLNALQPGEDQGANQRLSEGFKAMLQSEPVSIPSYEADVLNDSLIDWLDDDPRMRPYGAEDPDYESRVPPYLPANGLMVNLSELRMVNGAEPEYLQALMPLLCVLPGNSEWRVNVNTLTEQTAPVLIAALGPGVTVETAKSLVSNRPPDGWQDVSDFLGLPEISALSLTEQQKQRLTVTTEHFILHTRARYNEASFSMTSLIRVSDGKQSSVISREFGGY
ncbi:Type II secretion system protein K [Saliniradius amylolyticus]|uniref:Type II secretion system protein K n=1 Tax=Saliniradius amylolyticus TaxID=2183582 RepID=A0A2S2DZB5_9ALTE|nr:type II secretion system minor pseudopilin GspK [Saliniradius amylolyticus]AWL10622.1 Type II secretion system protein K [Saliniradius amylolyticus]